jgi:hypothetical protein
MGRLPSSGSTSGFFLGSGRSETLVNSSFFGTSATAEKNQAPRPLASAPQSGTQSKKTGLWGNGQSQTKNVGQWPLGSGSQFGENLP